MSNQMTMVNPVRQAPWIGIGTSGMWTDYREALIDSQLDFTVVSKDAKAELEYINGLVYYETIPGVQANVREQDNRILGCVSKQYGIVQNHQAFAMLEPFTKAGGIITNAGMTEQGLVFMVLRMRQENLQGDDWDFDVMCTNSFNGAFPCALMMVPTRIICQNMYRQLMGGRSDALLHVRHGSQAEKKIEAASTVTGNVLQYISAFGATLGMARSKRLHSADIRDVMVPMIFPYPKPGGLKEQMSRERVDLLRQEFMDRYYDAPDNRKFQGTGLGFINAYYDYLSHRNPGKNMPGRWDHRRLSGLVSGNDVKQKAIKEAM